MRPQIVTVSDASGGAKDSAVITFDIFHDPFNVSLGCVVTGSVDYTVYHTFDDLFNTAASSCTWFPHDNSDLVNATANQNDNFAFPVTGAKVTLNSGSGSVTMTAIQAGSAGGPT